MKRKIVFIFILMLTITLLIGCQPSTPADSVISEDLIGESFYTTKGKISIDDISEIIDLDIINENLFKEERRLELQSIIILKKEYVDITMDLLISYTYIPGAGWVFDYSIVNSEDVIIEFNAEINENNVTEIVKDVNLELANSDRWWKLDSIENINIIEQNIDNDKLTNAVTVELESNSDVEKLNAKVDFELVYDMRRKVWYLSDSDVIESSLILYRGIEVESAKELFDNKTFNDILTFNYNNNEENLSWKIKDISEFKEFEVEKNEFNSDVYEDAYRFKIRLEKYNISCEGYIEAIYTYTGSKWELSEYWLDGAFTYSLIKTVEPSKELLWKNLENKKLTYKTGYWNNYLYFDEDTVISLDIIHEKPSDYGKTLIFVTAMELENDSTRLVGEAKITYKLDNNSGEWYVYGIKRVNDFEEFPLDLE